MNKFEQLSMDIDELEEDDLIDLNQQIVARLNFLRQLRTHKSMLKLKVGQLVRFITDDGIQVRGIISKFNQKTVSVVTPEGRTWRVSPGLLKPFEAKRGKTDSDMTLRLNVE